MCQSAPTPPDPKDTSAAQTGTSIATALANANLQNVNRVGPDGTSMFSQSGTYDFTDPYTGKSYAIPQFTNTVSLSPEQQKIYDQNQAAKLNLAQTGNQQSAFLEDYLGTPVDLSTGNIEKYISDHFSDDFNKQQDRQLDSLTTRLANQGIGAGSEAYNRAIAEFSTNRNDAYDNLYGNQYANAQRSILTERNQPLNEISALLSGSQVSQPAFDNHSQPTIPTTDNAGLINTNYQQRLANWQQEQATTNGILGGLFKLGGSFLI